MASVASGPQLSRWINQPTSNTSAHRHRPAFQRKTTTNFPSVTFLSDLVRRVSSENPPAGLRPHELAPPQHSHVRDHFKPFALPSVVAILPFQCLSAWAVPFSRFLGDTQDHLLRSLSLALHLTSQEFPQVDKIFLLQSDSVVPLVWYL